MPLPTPATAADVADAAVVVEVAVTEAKVGAAVAVGAAAVAATVANVATAVMPEAHLGATVALALAGASTPAMTPLSLPWTASKRRVLLQTRLQLRVKR